MGETYEDWLARNPYPSTLDLMAKYGSYAAIPDSAWKVHDALCAAWRARLSVRHKMDHLDRVTTREGLRVMYERAKKQGKKY